MMTCVLSVRRRRTEYRGYELQECGQPATRLVKTLGEPEGFPACTRHAAPYEAELAIMITQSRVTAVEVVPSPATKGGATHGQTT